MIAPIAMRMFLRQSAVGTEPLAIAMTGVRMGDRLLQIGVDDPAIAAALAAKPGLSGDSAVIVANEAAAALARQATDASGTLVNLHTQGLHDFPFAEASFDLVVIHNRSALLTHQGAGSAAELLRECTRVVRSGGRVVVLEKGSPSGLTAIFGRKGPGGDPEATVRALTAAGFRAVRLLADKDNYRFIEGMKP